MSCSRAARRAAPSTAASSTSWSAARCSSCAASTRACASSASSPTHSRAMERTLNPYQVHNYSHCGTGDEAGPGALGWALEPSAMKPQVIALEEHYLDPEVARHFKEPGPEARDPALRERLNDVGALRIREMDEAGIDLQVLSHAAPATQRLDAESAPAIARAANDRLKETVGKSNGRFAAFAVLPTANPKAAVDELDRAVTRLGFKGAMVHGLTNGRFFDERQFWPICERAQALDVPLYMHPAVPHPAVIEAYYRDYLKEYPGLEIAAWGFTVETATQGISLVPSGGFAAYPRLTISLDHLGESLPFPLWRIDNALSRNTG